MVALEVGDIPKIRFPCSIADRVGNIPWPNTRTHCTSPPANAGRASKPRATAPYTPSEPNRKRGSDEKIDKIFNGYNSLITRSLHSKESTSKTK